MTPPDSVGKVVAEMLEHADDLENAAVQIEASDLADKFTATAAEFRKAAAEVTDRATRLQALDRLRLEEAKQLAADCLHMYDRFAAAQARAEAAEAALREARTHVTGYVGLAKITGYDSLIPLLRDFLNRDAALNGGQDDA